MEHILAFYARPYSPEHPVVCFDERPCFLIGDTVEPIAMQSGQIRKEHYAYERFGSCALLAAIEPLTGRRVAEVYAQRTKKEFTLILSETGGCLSQRRKDPYGSGQSQHARFQCLL